MKNLMNRLNAFLVMALMTPKVFALNNEVDLDVPDDGPLAKVGALMQSAVDFLGGPGVMFVVFVGLVAAWMLWVIVPKSSGTAIGYIARAVAGGVMVMNLALFFTWMQGF